MFFDPASYSVPEGESLVLVLRADKQFEVPFTINITLMDMTAVGKCLAYSFPLYYALYTEGNTFT